MLMNVKRGKTVFMKRTKMIETILDFKGRKYHWIQTTPTPSQVYFLRSETGDTSWVQMLHLGPATVIGFLSKLFGDTPLKEHRFLVIPVDDKRTIITSQSERLFFLLDNLIRYFTSTVFIEWNSFFIREPDYSDPFTPRLLNTFTVMQMACFYGVENKTSLQKRTWNRLKLPAQCRKDFLMRMLIMDQKEVYNLLVQPDQLSLWALNIIKFMIGKTISNGVKVSVPSELMGVLHQLRGRVFHGSIWKESFGKWDPKKYKPKMKNVKVVNGYHVETWKTRSNNSFLDHALFNTMACDLSDVFMDKANIEVAGRLKTFWSRIKVELPKELKLKPICSFEVAKRSKGIGNSHFHKMLLRSLWSCDVGSNPLTVSTKKRTRVQIPKMTLKNCAAWVCFVYHHN